jgi:hypothetical protein
MDANLEAAGDAVTGAVIAKTLDKPASAEAPEAIAALCKNCKTPAVGKYCAVCGQVPHPHRSLISLGHDILHGVFHVEGRIWHTLPELFFKPGRLTRRYIDGERAKFIAPLPLFLFSVFFMFAVFAFTPDDALNYFKNGNVVETWRVGNANAMATTEKLLEERRAALAAPELAPEKRAEIEKQIAELEASQKVMQALSRANWAQSAKSKDEVELQSEKASSSPGNVNINFDIPESAGDNRWVAAIREAQQNPGLLFYKVKTNIYKFSWALIPLSLPFMWLLFFWRRDVHMYDHAIFVTYSLSFMMLLLVMLAILGMFGVSSDLRSAIFGVVAPVHLYKQMRVAYASSALGTFARLFFLSIFISIVLTIFLAMLLVLGVLG